MYMVSVAANLHRKTIIPGTNTSYITEQFRLNRCIDGMHPEFGTKDQMDVIPDEGLGHGG
jgi:hypothetical protein